MNLRTAVLLLVIIGSRVAFLTAQTNCRVVVQPAQGRNFFNPEQEEYLGDVLARSGLVHMRAIEDEEMVAPLRAIVARLSRLAPETAPKFKVTLVDIPEANAFSLPGGRIFLTKKLIAAARTEDDLAGVLAHEMGHQLARQVTHTYSEFWHAVLNIDSVRDRADIEEKYNQFLDTYATNPRGFEGAFARMNREQMEADSAGFSLLTRAGYDPKTYSEFFDRLTGNRGKTGNWFSDFWGVTRPESRRFREMLRSAVLPRSECADSSAHMSAAEFSRWRKNVIAYSGFGKKDSDPEKGRTIPEPLRPELRHLRFSPDGKYILGQDAGSIYVLTREPLANLFRVDAEDADNAEFTPDSSSIVFTTENLRISTWSIEEKQPTYITELHFTHECIQRLLSPTGEFLACMQLGDDGEFPLQVQLVEVKTGNRVWLKQGVYKMHWWNPRLPIHFSSDGRYFAGSGMSGAFAFDLQSKSEVSLSSAVKRYLGTSFAFLGPDTLIGFEGGPGARAAVVRFPSGELVSADVSTGSASLFSPGHGDYVILQPVEHASAGIMNLKAKKIFLASKTPAIDIYDGVVVNELTDGKLGLYSGKDAKAFATVDLPEGPLATFRAIAASPDLRFVAYSDNARGAVWDITTAKRLGYLRGFRGAHFDTGKTLVATFPPPDSYHPGTSTRDDPKQSIPRERRNEPEQVIVTQAARLEVDSGQMQKLAALGKRYFASQDGTYLLASTFLAEDGKPLKEWRVESRDIFDGKTLWSRRIRGPIVRGFTLPRFYTQSSNALSFLWDSEDPDAKELIRNDPKLHARVDALGKRKIGIKILEVVDHQTGVTRFSMPIDTGDGSFRVDDIDVVDDTVLLRDGERITLLDSSGNRKARLFASRAVLDKSGKLMAAQTEPGRLKVYSVDNMTLKAQFTFSGPIAFITFSDDGRTLLVLTVQQTVFTLPIT